MLDVSRCVSSHDRAMLTLSPVGHGEPGVMSRRLLPRWATSSRTIVRESTVTITVDTVGGAPQRVLITDLRLDWRNPRLPPERQLPDAEQFDLALYIDKRYNPLEVAQSIARHGYFESEPLIAVEEQGALVVVEGNRRLTALLGLSNGALREALVKQTRGWDDLPRNVQLPTRIPVVVVDERKSVAPLLGFRHISGIKEWEPFAQARYLADLVEDEGYTLNAIAELVGRPHLEVKKMYRDHEIVRQADDVFELDVSRVTQDFGVFNAAMDIRNIRLYIDAPTAGSVTTTQWPLVDSARPRVERLLTYMYGDARGRGRVLPESRRLRDLGYVLADSSGRAEEALLRTADLNEALEALNEPGELALKRLNAALNAVQRVIDEGPAALDAEAAAVLVALSRAVEALEERTDGRSEPGGGV